VLRLASIRWCIGRSILLESHFPHKYSGRRGLLGKWREGTRRSGFPVMTTASREMFEKYREKYRFPILQAHSQKIWSILLSLHQTKTVPYFQHFCFENSEA